MSAVPQPVVCIPREFIPEGYFGSRWNTGEIFAGLPVNAAPELFACVEKGGSRSIREQNRLRRPGAMQYLLLIYNNESEWMSMSEAEGAKMLQEFGAFTQSIITNGN